MARWLKADGTEQELHPKARNTWTLEEIQGSVGGPFEVMPGLPPPFILMNELGTINDLPVNASATAYLHERMAERLGIPVRLLAQEVGTRLRYLPVLRGDVLIVGEGERL